MKYDGVCSNCGKVFTTTAGQRSRLRHGENKHIFCCHQCSVEFYKGKPRPVKYTAPLPVNCAHCGKSFELDKDRRSRLEKEQQANFYCSRECYHLSRFNYRHTEESKRKIALSRTGERHPFYGKNQSEESNRKRAEALKGSNNHRWAPNAPIVKCAYCGEKKRLMPHQYKVSKTKTFYCNNKCRAKHWEQIMIGENNPNWLGGINFEPYNPAFNKQLKEFVRRRDGYQCQLCGTAKNKVSYGHNTFIVHHIDYDKQNSSPENLITLCSACNSMVNYNRDKWKQYFQLMMLERREGRLDVPCNQ